MSTPQIGDAAPEFALKDQNGNDVKLSQYRGKNVVLYFYPKDNTSGCTQEACDFRDEHSALGAAGAVVLGVSPDDVRSHEKFATKFSLPFPLLADSERKVCEAYGVWGEKSLYGRKFMGVTRTTFLINPEGKVARVWSKVKVGGHVQEILQSLKGAPAGEGGAAPKAKKAPAKKTTKKAAPAGKAVTKKAAPATRAAKTVAKKVASAGRALVKKAASVGKAVAKKAPAKKAAARRR